MQHALREEKKQKNVYGVLVGNAEGRKPLGRTRRRVEDAKGS
jgi:hypothetical protein